MSGQLDDEAIHSILTRAAAIDGQSQVDRQILERSAAELGISPEALIRAEAEILAERAKKTDELRYQDKLKAEFMENLVPYILVNGMLIGIWWFTGANHFWPIYPLLGWGIGVGTHFFSMKARGPEYDRRFEKWRAKEARRNKAAETLEDRLASPRPIEESDSVSDSA